MKTENLEEVNNDKKMMNSIGNGKVNGINKKINKNDIEYEDMRIVKIKQINDDLYSLAYYDWFMFGETHWKHLIFLCLIQFLILTLIAYYQTY